MTDSKKASAPQESDLITSEPLYSPEILKKAQDELSRLTPSDYQQMVDYMEAVDEQSILPEAAGVSWATVYSKQGLKLNLTARSVSLKTAAEVVLHAFIYLKEKYGFSIDEPRIAPPTSPTLQEQIQTFTGVAPAPTMTTTLSVPPTPPTVSAPPQPQYVDSAGKTAQPGPAVGNMGTGLETIRVTGLAHIISRDGNSHYLRAYGGRFSQYGVPAYEEVLPSGFQFLHWPATQKFTQIPENMQYMTVETYVGSDNKNKFKVVAFSDHT